MQSFVVWIVVFLLCASCCRSNGAKILGVLVSESKSHYYAVSNVADELASRGHQVCEINSMSIHEILRTELVFFMYL